MDEILGANLEIVDNEWIVTFLKQCNDIEISSFSYLDILIWFILRFVLNLYEVKSLIFYMLYLLSSF